ncbi:MAG: class I SAM-dependent methyltransferase [Deltaproteobacteria bacterium]|nr:class I SAM-dependent methyltransferase [Deltaproteobacteria bacterium]
MPASHAAPPKSPAPWGEGFFDADYLRLWSELVPQVRTEQDASGIWSLLGLEPGARVLDAPCGYGRLSLLLARRGASVLGVDWSAALLEEAERRRGDLPPGRLRYRRHDLREPLEEEDMDAAVNVLSSLGYGTEDEDRDILRTVGGAVRPGGRVLIETLHRDAFVASYSRGVRFSQRFADGTLMVEEPRFDALAGRVETSWHWCGPRGSGAKTASLRIYTLTELARLLESVGLQLISAHQGCSSQPFDPAGPDAGGRVGLLARTPSE